MTYGEIEAERAWLHALMTRHLGCVDSVAQSLGVSLDVVRRLLRRHGYYARGHTVDWQAEYERQRGPLLGPGWRPLEPRSEPERPRRSRRRPSRPIGRPETAIAGGAAGEP